MPNGPKALVSLSQLVHKSAEAACNHDAYRMFAFAAPFGQSCDLT